MRSVTPVEAAVGVAIAGSLLATAVPAFLENLHASRLAEPLDVLQRIAARATHLASGRPAIGAYPESAPLTPARVAAGDAAQDPAGTWDHPTWRELGVSFEGPHSFSFAFDSRNAEGFATFAATAHGDLDGDGVLSTFRISGESRDGKEPLTHPMDIDREVE